MGPSLGCLCVCARAVVRLHIYTVRRLHDQFALFAIVIVVVVESSNYSIAQWRTLLVRLKLFPIKLIHCLFSRKKKVSTFDFDFSDSGESFIDTGSSSQKQSSCPRNN